MPQRSKELKPALNNMKSFVDPKIEGFFSTSDSRTTAHKYIGEQIDAHQAIIFYYKRQFNALNDTCSVSPEVLACIFDEIIDKDALVNGRTWISQISHVCFHWRRVALSTPCLWSTITFVGSDHESIRVINSKDWVSTMLQRSKCSPLSVMMQSWNLLDPDQFRLVLKETLASHLPRIAVRELSLTHNFETRECWELLHLLGSHDALMLKRCRMENNGIYYGGRWRRVQFNLPDRFITQSALLESFSLIGYGLNWEILHGFQSLKTVFLRIPSPFAPSNAQILRFLSRTPLLEQLTIYGICISPDQDGSSLHDAELIHLKSVDISCNREFLPPFFDHLIFPKKFKLDVRSDQTYEIQDVSFTTLQNWLGKIDDAHAGSAARLILDRDRELVFWKPEETQLDSEPVGSSWTLEDGSELYAPTSIAHCGFLISKGQPGCYVHAPYPATSPNIVKIHFERFRKNLNEAIFRSLRLDQLVSLVVDSAYLDIEGWALAGGLPRLESLELDVFGYHGFADSDWWMYHPRLPHLQVESLEVDVPGFHEYSDSDQWRYFLLPFFEALRPAPLSFPALVSLTLGSIKLVARTRKTTPVDILCDILKLRTYSELPRLRWLGLVDVSLDDSEGEDLKLDRLEEFADEFNFQLKSKFLYQKSTVMM